MPVRLLIVFAVGLLALLALPFLLIGLLGSLVFDEGFLLILLIPVLIVGFLVFRLYRNWKRLSNFARGGDPFLKRSGFKTQATITAVQPMPLGMSAPNGARQAVHAVRLAAPDPNGDRIEFASFRTAEAILPPPNVGDGVTVYIDRERRSQVFVDWETLVAGGGRSTASPVTIDGEVVEPANDASDAPVSLALPADESVLRARINAFTPQPYGAYTLDLRVMPRDRPHYDTVLDVEIPAAQAESLAVGRVVKLVSDPRDPERLEIAWD